VCGCNSFGGFMRGYVCVSDLVGSVLQKLKLVGHIGV
jgi:hypothetical protein